MQRVNEILQVSAVCSAKSGNQLEIHAIGQVPTSGWSAAQLTAWKYVTDPVDGVQDFDLTAEEPKGVALQVISTVDAAFIGPVDIANYWAPNKPLRGLRIHGKSNFILSTIDTGASLIMDPTRFFGPPGTASLNFEIQTLIGRPVRVVAYGQPVTMDLVPSRVNIFLTEDGHHISRITFG